MSKFLELFVLQLCITTALSRSEKYSVLDELSKNFSLTYLDAIIFSLEVEHGSYLCIDELVKVADNFEKGLDGLKYSTYSTFVPNAIETEDLFDFGYYRRCMSQKHASYCIATATKHNNFVKQDDRTWSDRNLTSYMAEWMHHINITRKANKMIGLCLPTSCSPSDAEKIANQLIGDADYKVFVDRCEGQVENVGLSRYHIVCIFFLAIVFIFHLAAPLMPKELKLSVFDLRENWNLFRQTQLSDEMVPSLYGLKSISMLLVVMGNLQYLAHIPEKRQIFHEKSHLAFIGPTFNAYLYLMDTFYAMSGFLSVRSASNRFRGISNFKISTARYLRFVVIVGWTLCLNFLLFHPFIKKHFAGPLWETFVGARKLTEACEDHWWSDLLLLDVWRFKTNQCTITSWTLSNDLTFFTSTLYFVIPWLDVKPIVVIGMALSIFTTLSISGATMRKINYPPTVVSNQLFTPGYFDYFNLFLTKPWAHGTNYLLGAVLAVCMKRQRTRLPKDRQLMYSLLCLIFFAMFLVSEHAWSHVVGSNQLMAIVYGSTIRLVWTMAFCWIIYASHTQNQFGWLKRILSSRFFIPLSRLNLSLLMTNFVVIRLRNATREHPSSNPIWERFCFEWIPSLLLIYTLALVGTLTIEIPFSRLIKRLFGLREKAGVGRILTRPQIYNDFSLAKNSLSQDIERRSTKIKYDGAGFYSIKF